MDEKSRPLPFESSVRLLVLPLWILAIFAVGMLMSEAAPIFLWFVSAFFLFILLDPIAEFLKAHRWPTVAAAVFLVLGSTIITAIMGYIFYDLFSSMVAELDQSRQIFIHIFQSASNSWSSWTASLHLLPTPPVHGAGSVPKIEVVQGSPLGGEMSGTILHGVGSAVTVLTFSLLVPILAFFFLAERDTFAKVLAKAYQKKASGETAWKKIVTATRAFFVGNLVLGLITYPVFVLLFWQFSVPSIFTVAALATFFNLIPFVGAVLSGLLPAVAMYAQDQSVGAPLGLYGCCVLIHFVVADFVTPKLLGSKVNINATTSTIALVAWGELWGGVGLVLAIPLTSFIKIMFEHSNFAWLEWIAALMSEAADEPLKIAKKKAPALEESSTPA